ncbi:uncharacterized protein LOC121424110 [Lytechinus variegatus]|uniref:uncharacterized protein LOC121424110 n=1 Tax=Lytechinus variegatus TaxID=7654 RepID=UPI001BB15615|nr:uncharacterized protein LOC121424110 [Lytechinus variegatus]
MSNHDIVKILRGEVTYPSPVERGKKDTYHKGYHGYDSSFSTIRQVSTSSSLSTASRSSLIPSRSMRMTRANVGLPTMPRADSYRQKRTVLGEIKRLKSAIKIISDQQATHRPHPSLGKEYEVYH